MKVKLERVSPGATVAGQKIRAELYDGKNLRAVIWGDCAIQSITDISIMNRGMTSALIWAEEIEVGEGAEKMVSLLKKEVKAC